MLYFHIYQGSPVLAASFCVPQDRSDKIDLAPRLFFCHAQLNVKLFLLINVKMPTIVGILTFMSGKNNILGLSEWKMSQIS